MITLTKEQHNVVDFLIFRFDNSITLTTFGGAAGVGKTTLIRYFTNKLSHNIRIAFCAFTGKASSVMRNKLKISQSIKPSDYCGTVHSLIYFPEIDSNDRIIGWELKSKINYDLIILDESSMINEDLFKDLSGYNIPIIAVGDCFQLPPITGNLNLMKKPDIILEKIHRQSEGNPIIKVSNIARLEGYIPYGTYGESVVKVRRNDPLVSEFIKYCGDFSESVVLCGFNKTRVSINQKIRKLYGKDTSPLPIVGDRVVCLRNNKDSKFCPIYNGIQGVVIECNDLETHLEMRISIDGEERHYKGPVAWNCFDDPEPDLSQERIFHYPQYPDKGKDEYRWPDYFDYGYAITTHKSQGSEWRRVMVIEQPCSYWSGDNWNRWLYTAVTRASEQLLIVR